MSKIIPFEYRDKPVRALQIDGDAWFNANDVCEALEMGNPRQALQTHVDDEDVQKLDTPTEGGYQQQNFINESGLYSLIFGSHKPEAKRFKRWVTSEVLPSIRKTGSYTAPKARQPSLSRSKLEAITKAGELAAKAHGSRKPEVYRAAMKTLEKAADVDLSEFLAVIDQYEAGAQRAALERRLKHSKLASSRTLAEKLCVPETDVDRVLEKLGLQEYQAGQWRITEQGREYGAEYSGVVIFSRLQVLPLLEAEFGSID